VALLEKRRFLYNHSGDFSSSNPDRSQSRAEHIQNGFGHETNV
jgi:hypothetical protein